MRETSLIDKKRVIIMKSARLSYAGHNWPKGTSEWEGSFSYVWEVWEKRADGQMASQELAKRYIQVKGLFYLRARERAVGQMTNQQHSTTTNNDQIGINNNQHEQPITTSDNQQQLNTTNNNQQ